MTASIPLARIRTRGTVFSGIDGTPVVVRPAAGGPRTTHDGFGDLTVGAAYTATLADDLEVELSGRVKFPTATRRSGLSTGGTDYSAGAQVTKVIGAFAPFVSGAYRLSDRLDDDLASILGLAPRIDSDPRQPKVRSRPGTKPARGGPSLAARVAQSFRQSRSRSFPWPGRTAATGAFAAILLVALVLGVRLLARQSLERAEATAALEVAPLPPVPDRVLPDTPLEAPATQPVETENPPIAANDEYSAPPPQLADTPARVPPGLGRWTTARPQTAATPPRDFTSVPSASATLSGREPTRLAPASIPPPGPGASENVAPSSPEIAAADPATVEPATVRRDRRLSSLDALRSLRRQ